MGANASKESGLSRSTHHKHHKIEDLVDLGSVLPNNIYPTTQQDYDARSVRQLIVQRKLAPFYKGLPDAPELVTEPGAESTPMNNPSFNTTTNAAPGNGSNSSSNAAATGSGASASAANTSASSLPPHPPAPKQSSSSSLSPPLPQHLRHTSPSATGSRSRSASNASDRQRAYVERMRQREKALYDDATECPICFLYYPANINHSRCCDQPICTECFLQIKRPPETPAEPASCPFCMEANFGVVYEPPAWSEKYEARHASSANRARVGPSSPRHTTSGVSDGSKPRRKSVNAKNPNVVLIDHVRPDWNKHLAPNPRAASRRNSESNEGASRSFLRTTPIFTRPGRSASSAASTEYNHYLGAMRDMNMDLEEFMVMEAIRMSLAEQEERERQQQQQQQQLQQRQQQQEQRSLDGQPEEQEEEQGEDEDDDNEPLANNIQGYQPPSDALTSATADGDHSHHHQEQQQPPQQQHQQQHQQHQQQSSSSVQKSSPDNTPPAAQQLA
ncbi:hypothetical protein BCR43DRAFT_526338 [Syncephalastrum racemosum]|uniref:RING-type domain-containing protein n=1 Tax=Syncephalastrum racemosum TaxID=13706 RepID=A0A1X2H634_SYNRA|nr:hypothetical protein BCR43DRAFT_526338 [Syncephalastrum racemosum]